MASQSSSRSLFGAQGSGLSAAVSRGIGRVRSAAQVAMPSFSADSSSLKRISTDLRSVITNIGVLDTKVQALTSSLTAAANQFDRLVGASTSVSSGANNITAGAVSAGQQRGGRLRQAVSRAAGGTPPPSAGAAPKSGSDITAGVVSAGASGGTPPLSTGVVSSSAGPFRRAASRVGSAIGGTRGGLALGVAGEIGAQWAGKISTAVSSLQSGNIGIDLIARQANQIAGGGISPMNTVGRFTTMNSFSPTDLQSALSALSQNPLVFNLGSPGLQNQTVRFSNQLQKLNPLLGAAGAAGVINSLTSPTTMNQLQMYAGPTGGLLNMYGQENSPNQTFKSLLGAVSMHTITDAAQAKAAAKNPKIWADIAWNAQQMGVSPQMVTMLQQYAGSGMNLNAAEPKGAVASSTLARTTAKTQLGATAYESTAWTQNHINAIMTHLTQLGSTVLKTVPQIGAFAFGISMGTKAVLSFGSAAADAIALLKGARSVVGGFGGGGVVAAETAGSTAAAADVAGATSGVAAADAAGAVGGSLAADTAGVAAAGGAGLLSKLGGLGGGLGTLGIGAGLMLGGSTLGSLVAHGKGGGWGQTGSAVSAAARDAGIGLMLTGNPLGALIGGALGAGASEISSHFGKTISGWAKSKNPLVHAGGSLLNSVLGVLGDPPTRGMQPALSSGLNAMMRDNPNIQVNSGVRSTSEQAALYALKGGKNVARPGHSRHQTGQAADIGPPSQFGWIAANAANYGLHTPSGAEPWHVEAIGDVTAATFTKTSFSGVINPSPNMFLADVAMLGTSWGASASNAKAKSPTATTMSSSSGGSSGAQGSGSGGAPPSGGVVTAGNIGTPAAFSSALLQALGLPVTNQGITDINAWQEMEGQWGASGIFNATKMFDPLNTKMPEAGAVSIGGGATMKYTSWSQGVQATRDTILQKNNAFLPIYDALKANASLMQFTKAVESTPWAGSGYGGKAFPTPSGIYAGDPVGATFSGSAGTQQASVVVNLGPVTVNGTDAQSAQQFVQTVLREIQRQASNTLLRGS